MGESSDIGGSREMHSSISAYGKGSKNKRKYLAEFPLDMIDVSALSLTEFPRYELLEEKLRNTQIELAPVEARSDNPCQEHEVEEPDQDEWDDPVVCQLQELLSSNLLETFRSAIKKVVESGYSSEVAEQLILRSGLYHGTKDVVSNAVDGALALVSREKELETSRHHVFEDLDSLVNYTILEMIAVVREVRPCLTVGEAMWWLLICDLNLLHACIVDRDHLSSFCIPEYSGESPCDSTVSPLTPEAAETSDQNLNKSCTSKLSAPRTKNSHSEMPAIAAVSQLPNLKNSHVHDVAITGKEGLVPPGETRGKSLSTGREHAPTVTQAVVEEKAVLSRKGSAGSSKRDMLRQKTFHFEKSYKGRMSKGAFKAKLTTWGSMVLDKSLKSPSGSSGVVMKSTYSKITTSIGANGPLPDGNCNISSNSTSVHQGTDAPSVLSVADTVFALPAVNKNNPTSSTLDHKPAAKAKTNHTNSSEVPDYYAGIPYDESLGKYVPQDDKEETIVNLASHMKALQKEIEVWKDWANEKVMQATRRLSKDQVELKMLRQEKEEADRFKKEMPALEEGSMKRLSEMEYAISNAAAQIDTANLSIHRLENENNVLKSQAEAARFQALKASTNFTKAVKKEQEALKGLQLADTEKIALQEELATLKHHLADLQHQLEKAKTRKNQFEVEKNKFQALWKQEEREKLKYYRQAESLKRETEQQKARTKAEEDNLRETDERNLQNCMENVKKLEKEISELRLESESSKIAALLRGVDIGYGSGLMGSKVASACQGFQVPKINKRLAVFQDNFGAGAGSVRPERECVMCLTEEMSVVFLPCSHQVLCAECNVLHEKQGMKDCPSCRTAIQQRIPVRYLSAQHP